MGYYIEVDALHGKAQLIADGKALIRGEDGWEPAPPYKAQIIPRPRSFADIPDGKALICVIGNSLFEAAGYCYDEREFEAFTDPSDHRPREWVLMDKPMAEVASGRGGAA